MRRGPNSRQDQDAGEGGRGLELPAMGSTPRRPPSRTHPAACSLGTGLLSSGLVLSFPEPC